MVHNGKEYECLDRDKKQGRHKIIKNKCQKVFLIRYVCVSLHCN